jgi:hypothetical protein
MTAPNRHAEVRKEKWYETVWFALVLILVVVAGFCVLFTWHQ